MNIAQRERQLNVLKNGCVVLLFLVVLYSTRSSASLAVLLFVLALRIQKRSDETIYRICGLKIKFVKYNFSA